MKTQRFSLFSFTIPLKSNSWFSCWFSLLIMKNANTTEINGKKCYIYLHKLNYSAALTYLPNDNIIQLQICLMTVFWLTINPQTVTFVFFFAGILSVLIIDVCIIYCHIVISIFTLQFFIEHKFYSSMIFSFIQLSVQMKTLTYGW